MRRKPLIFLLIISGLFVLLTACGQLKFDGTREATADSYQLDIEKMNGTDTHTLKLNAGDVLDVWFQTEYGKLYMEIKAPDGTLICTGNGEETTDFTVNISDSGEYSVCVEAKGARGKICVRRKTI